MRTTNHGPGAYSPRSIRFQGRQWLLATMACFVLISATWAPGASAANAVLKETTFPRKSGDSAIGASGNVILNAVSRRGYQVSRLDRTVLNEFDLDSLQILRTIDFPKLSEAPAQRSTDWQWILDQGNNKLHFLVDTYEGSFETKKLASMDLSTFEVSSPITLWPNAEATPLSFTFHPPTQRFYMLVRTTADALGVALKVEERDLNGALIGQHRLSSCYGALDMNYPPTTVRSLIDPNVLYLNCYASNGIQAQVVRIAIGSDGSLQDQDQEEIFPALPGPLSTAFDAGSDRMYFLTANRGAGRGAWVFDGLRSSFLGVIATGDTQAGQDYSLGIDPISGRIYMQTPAGLVIADARRTPLPSGLLFKELSGNGFGRIQVDPVRRRAFVPDASTANAVGLPQEFAVLRDNVPSSSDPHPSNPDLLTADVEEKDGVTDVNLTAAGRAFGFRTLTTGGTQRAIWNVALGNTAPDDLRSVNDLVYAVPLNPGNRDLYVARVKRVSLTDDETEAAVIPAEADEGTISDLESRSASWPFVPTSCRDSGGARQNTTGPSGMAGVSCDSSATAAWGVAGSDMVESPADGVKVRSTTASASVFKDPVKGLVTISQAVARGISFGPSVRVGEIRTTATTWARGRKGSASGTFERSINDVWIDTNFDGVADFRCESCDARATAAALGKALAGKATVLFPEPDPEFAGGSPGGFQAIIEKQRFLAYSERSLNDDDSPEVVGMEIIYYADAKAGRSRQVVQLAGVQAESHYGIYLIPKTESGIDIGKTLNDVTSLARSRGVALDDVPVVSVPSARPPLTLFERVVQTISKGWRLFRSSPGEAALLMALWSFFVMPIYMIQRRRLLGLR